MNIRSYRDLEVFKLGYSLAMEIFRLTKQFPREELYSMTDQMKRSSRSVCSNLAEAWRRRRTAAHFVSKLADAETEAEETRVWLDFAVDCQYLPLEKAQTLDQGYEEVLRKLVSVINHPEHWTIRK